MSDKVKAPVGNLKATCRCTCTNFKQTLQKPDTKTLKPGIATPPDKYIYTCSMCGKELVRSDIQCLTCNGSNITIKGRSGTRLNSKIPMNTAWNAYYCCADCK
jgi:DNA-directed RNA polymerase subunit RPC12/RpoP